MSHASNLRLLPPCAPAKRIDQLNLAVRLAFIRAVRRRAWTIEQAARECGASPDAVVKWISGKRRIPGSALFAVLDLASANDNKRAA